MKKAILKTILAGVMVLSLQAGAKAQLNLSINLGRQPAWGPTGYNHVDYYYLPDIECYYDVSTGQYIYQDGGQWIFANTLPPRYRGYDLYSGYKVVVNRPKPYLNFNRDRASYGRYKNWSGARQPMLRESRNMNHGGMNHGGGMNQDGNGMNRRNMNHGNNDINHGNTNQGNGMNRGNMNQGQQSNHMNNGQRGGQQQGQNHQQGQGGQPQNDGGHDDHGHH